MMSRSEYIVIACGTTVVLLNAIFPPLASNGYSFLFATSPGEIATGLLVAQTVGIVAVTLFLTLAFRLVPRDGVRSLTFAVALASLGVVCLLPLFESSPLLRGVIGGDLYPIADLVVGSLILAALWRAHAAFQPNLQASDAKEQGTN